MTVRNIFSALKAPANQSNRCFIALPTGRASSNIVTNPYDKTKNVA